MGDSKEKSVKGGNVAADNKEAIIQAAMALIEKRKKYEFQGFDILRQKILKLTKYLE